MLPGRIIRPLGSCAYKLPSALWASSLDPSYFAAIMRHLYAMIRPQLPVRADSPVSWACDQRSSWYVHHTYIV